MKIRLLIITIIIFSLCGLVSAQEDVEFRQEFDTWKTSVSENAVDTAQDQLFFMTKARRNDSKTATVKIGLFAILQNYEIIVKPLRYEKGSDGKLHQTKSFDKVKMSRKMPAGKVSDKAEFHNPTIVLFADSDANAIEISIKLDDGRNPKITLNLSQDKDTIGILSTAK